MNQHNENDRQAAPEAPASEQQACWSCKKPYTLAQRADADGSCLHCGAEIELDCAAAPSRDADLRSGDQVFDLAAPYFAWNAKSWHEATQGTIGMPALLNYTRAVVDAAQAPHAGAALVKTWQERTGNAPDATGEGNIESAMCAEIADLRAAMSAAKQGEQG